MNTTDICFKNCEICVEERKSQSGKFYRVVVCRTDAGAFDLCFYDKHIENKILRMMLGM